LFVYVLSTMAADFPDSWPTWSKFYRARNACNRQERQMMPAFLI